MTGPGVESHPGVLPPGTRLHGGFYRIESMISSGGFGITYAASDELGRTVALKECFPLGLAHRSHGLSVQAAAPGAEESLTAARANFLREARVLAMLDHPNVVRVQTLFEENGTAYMAMDFIHGSDLEMMMSAAPEKLDPQTLLGLTRTLLKALAYLHAQDVLHRDLKPSNIRIDPFGTPVLIDFGAAKQQTGNETQRASAFRVVSDGYSPNEFYVAGAAQGPASDLYSFAATLYAVITGAPPAVANARAQALFSGDPDPYEPLAGRYPGQDPRLIALIDRGLAMRYGDRPTSAEAWLAEIPELPPAPPPLPPEDTAAAPRRGRFLPGLLTGTALTAVAAYGVATSAPGLMMRLTGMDSTMEDIRDERDTALTALSSATGRLEMRNAEIDRLAPMEERAATLEAELESVRAELENSRSELDDSRRRIDDLAAAVVDTEAEQAQLAALRDELDAREAQITEAERDLALREQGIIGLRRGSNEAERLRADLDAARDALDAAIAARAEAETRLAVIEAGRPVLPWSNPLTLTPPQGSFRDMPVFSADGSSIAGLSRLQGARSRISVFDAGTGELLSDFISPSPFDNRIRFSNGGGLIVVDGAGENSFVVDALTGDVRASIPGNRPFRGAITDDDRWLVMPYTGDGGAGVEIYDLEAPGTEPRRLEITTVPGDFVRSALFVPGTDEFLAITDGRIVRMGIDGTLVEEAAIDGDGYSYVGFPRTGDRLWAFRRSAITPFSEAQVWDSLSDHRILNETTRPPYGNVEFSADFTRMLSYDPNADAWRVIDLEADAVVAEGRIGGSASSPAGLQISADGRSLFIGSGGTLAASLLDLESGETIQTLGRAADAVFSTDGRSMMTWVADEGPASVWRAGIPAAPEPEAPVDTAQEDSRRSTVPIDGTCLASFTGGGVTVPLTGAIGETAPLGGTFLDLADCGLPLSTRGFVSATPDFTLDMADGVTTGRFQLSVQGFCISAIIVRAADRWYETATASVGPVPFPAARLTLSAEELSSAPISVWAVTEDPRETCAATLTVAST
ncbi:protein kinase [Rhodobacterales bacterium HKCCE2091]|nr:protein kinase [Rhodobacterales bacterium HKCCE2091]